MCLESNNSKFQRICEIINKLYRTIVEFRVLWGEKEMKMQRSVTIWFGKEVTLEEVKKDVRNLYLKGYKVRAPFYIGYNLNDDFVLRYLKSSLDNSDFLYVIGEKGSLLDSIMEYAHETNKPVVGRDFKEKCLII